jgi:hypothetical protein
MDNFMSLQMAEKFHKELSSKTQIHPVAAGYQL